MATALLVISAASAVFGAVKQRKISKAQKRQNTLTNKIAAITRRRNVKRQLASSRIQAAQVQAAGFELGVAGSTAVEGAVAGITQDTASTIGQSNLQATGQGFIADLSNQISSLQTSIATASAVSSIAGGLAGNAQAVAGVEDFLGVGE